MDNAPRGNALRTVIGLAFVALTLFLSYLTCAAASNQPTTVGYLAGSDGDGGAVIQWSDGIAVYLSYTGSIVPFPRSRTLPLEESARVSVTLKGELERTDPNEWVVRKPDRTTSTVRTEWLPTGTLENVLVAVGPSGDVMFTMYGLVDLPMRTIGTKDGGTRQFPWGRYYFTRDGKSAVLLEGMMADGRTWQRIVLTTPEEHRVEAISVADSAGFLTTWREWVRDPKADGSVWAYAVHPDGSPRWPEPVRVFTDPGLKKQTNPIVLSDGASGAIVIANVGTRHRRADEIRAQRISNEGKLLWGASGKEVTGHGQ